MTGLTWHNSSKWPEYSAKEIEIPQISVHKMLETAAKDYPNNPYMIFGINGGKTISFKEINEMADRFATALVDMGVKKGDKVAIFLPNTPHYPVVFFGALKAGAVNVTCNPIYTAKELTFQVKDSGAETIVALDHENFYPTVLKVLKEPDVPIKNVIICKIPEFMSKLKGILGVKLGKIKVSKVKIKQEHKIFGDLMKQYEPNPPKIDIDLKNDLGLILYTGGTTGTPKGAMLTHENFVANVHQLLEVLPPEGRVKGQNVFIGGLPWYHSYGLTTCLLTAAQNAAAVVALPDPRTPYDKEGKGTFGDILDSIQKYKATYFHAVPTLYGALLQHPNIKEYDLSSLRACLSGAAPLPKQIADDFEAVTHGNVVEGWGLTETSPVATANPLNGEKINTLNGIGSIGVPVPNTIVKTVDIDTGADLPEGKEGELAIKGPQVMKGYWNRPDETAEVMTKDGFFLTGDIGEMDEDGFFYITDRKKDMIIVSGNKVYPREVEEVLFKHPDVINAAVIGVPDERSSEKVKGFVVLKDGSHTKPEDIIEFTRDKLVPYKVPKLLEIRSELPMTAVGKVLRRQLRD